MKRKELTPLQKKWFEINGKYLKLVEEGKMDHIKAQEEADKEWQKITDVINLAKWAREFVIDAHGAWETSLGERVVELADKILKENK